jgi:hypothetical protein
MMSAVSATRSAARWQQAGAEECIRCKNERPRRRRQGHGAAGHSGAPGERREERAARRAHEPGHGTPERRVDDAQGDAAEASDEGMTVSGNASRFHSGPSGWRRWNRKSRMGAVAAAVARDTAIEASKHRGMSRKPEAARASLSPHVTRAATDTNESWKPTSVRLPGSAASRASADHPSVLSGRAGRPPARVRAWRANMTADRATGGSRP